MNTVTKTAWSNIRHNRSRNLLIGIAIVLTTLLLFLIPSIGYNIVELEFATINETYPTWHALYRGVDDKTAGELKSREEFSVSGLRSDVGVLAAQQANVSMMYIDETCMKLNKQELLEGSYPEAENEIVISKDVLGFFRSDAGIGDTVTLPYQVYRGDGLDYAQEGTFTISGLLEDNEVNRENKQYTALVSEAFMRKEVPAGEINYRIYFRINDEHISDSDKLEAQIKEIGAQFGLTENDMAINNDYIAANYVDPSMVPAIIGIMLIVILAGVITIYSIYYVSMIHRIQEYGKLRAIGATRHQLRQIVLREGLLVAVIAVPVGLIAGSVIIKPVFYKFLDFGVAVSPDMVTVMQRLLENGTVGLYHIWSYLLAAAVTLLTVYLSLLKPMRIAGKISAMEAIRFQGVDKKKKHMRKGYDSLNLVRLTKANLTRNKKRTMITILTMSFTGILVVVVATVLSCADPKESANASILGNYVVGINSEENNKEHPELSWKEIQKNNPLNEAFRQQIEALEGVTATSFVKRLSFYCSSFSEGADRQSIAALPEKYLKEALTYVTEGDVTYEDLKEGNKVLVEKSELRWNPQLKVGQTFTAEVEDMDEIRTVEMTIAGITDVPSAYGNYGGFIMAEEGIQKLANGQMNTGIIIESKEKVDTRLRKQLEELVETDPRFGMRSWENEYNNWRSGMVMISYGSYAFLIILGVICVTNLINTMINSIYMRKKELGMMQAIGLSEHQLLTMLQAEGLFYTAGALLLSLGVGSLAGYGMFLWAKADGMFNMQFYHYPTEAVLVMVGIIVGIQIVLSLLIGKSLKRQSLIERIRFSE